MSTDHHVDSQPPQTATDEEEIQRVTDSLVDDLIRQNAYYKAPVGDVMIRVKEVAKIRQRKQKHVAAELEWSDSVMSQVLLRTYNHRIDRHILKLREWCYFKDRGLVQSMSTYCAKNALTPLDVAKHLEKMGVTPEDLYHWRRFTLPILKREAIDRAIVQWYDSVSSSSGGDGGSESALLKSDDTTDSASQSLDTEIVPATQTYSDMEQELSTMSLWFIPLPKTLGLVDPQLLGFTNVQTNPDGTVSTVSRAPKPKKQRGRYNVSRRLKAPIALLDSEFPPTVPVPVANQAQPHAPTSIAATEDVAMTSSSAPCASLTTLVTQLPAAADPTRAATEEEKTTIMDLYRYYCNELSVSRAWRDRYIRKLDASEAELIQDLGKVCEAAARLNVIIIDDENPLRALSSSAASQSTDSKSNAPVSNATLSKTNNSDSNNNKEESDEEDEDDEDNQSRNCSRSFAGGSSSEEEEEQPEPLQSKLSSKKDAKKRKRLPPVSDAESSDDGDHQQDSDIDESNDTGVVKRKRICVHHRSAQLI